ncbi:MAG: HD domain-containing protein [Deltaproteobacteria bacterium]|jgi:HD-GYP domain-containing protein (c-di-GMP phosphodiesterase class II)|nr:HD domain-containing protein [Deltaproteobacteria bacterium]
MQAETAKKAAKKVATPGEKLLHNMFRLLQVVKIHQSNNKLFSDNVKLFQQVLEEIWGMTNVANFALHRGRFYLNDERIVYTPTMWATSAKMAEYFQARGINGIKFIDRGILSQESIVGFMDVFNRATKAPDPTEWLEKATKENYPWVEVNKDDDKGFFTEGQAGGDAAAGRSVVVHGAYRESAAQVARQTYSQALTALRTLVQRLAAGKNAGVQKSKRVIEQLIDMLFEDETSCLCLSTVRDMDDQLYTHSVNVAILALCVGRRLGLSRTALEQLGLAGLFYDLGKAGELEPIAARPERLKGAELERVHDHALLSVLSIIRMNASHGLKHSVLAAAGEHHMGMDHSGYPHVGREDEPISINGRILAVADQYDALTSVRPWREPYAPHDALVMLMREAGKKLDPVILKLFVSLLGTWPPGSVLVLDTHEVAMAHYTPSPMVGARPMAKLLKACEDGTFSPGASVDLGETDPATGLYLRNILSTIHPSRLNLQPVEFLLPQA